jgi:site-specific DNA-methyltransferase (adenine-specific)
MPNTTDEFLDHALMQRLICGDCLEVIPRLLANTIDLVVTSPPYAKQRSKHYDSVSEEEYPEWTLRWLTAVERVLKPTGSVMVVARAHILKGKVSSYLLRTRLACEDAGWYTPQDLIWAKPGSLPTGRVNRFRQEHETILWFSRNPEICHCDPKANGTPSDRLAELKGELGGNGKGFNGGVGQQHRRGVREGRFHEVPDLKPQTSGIARSTDVFTAGPGGCNKAVYNTHPAQHPNHLYRQLVRACCPPNGTILDPFAGSGTLMEASFHENRHSVSIDNKEEYVEIARRRYFDLESEQRRLEIGSPDPFPNHPGRTG